MFGGRTEEMLALFQNKRLILCQVKQVKAEMTKWSLTPTSSHHMKRAAPKNNGGGGAHSPSARQSLALDSAAKGSDCPHVLIYSLSFCKHTEQRPSVQPNRSHDTSPHGQVAFCKYSTKPVPEAWKCCTATCKASQTVTVSMYHGVRLVHKHHCSFIQTIEILLHYSRQYFARISSLLPHPSVCTCYIKICIQHRSTTKLFSICSTLLRGGCLTLNTI